MLQLNIYCSWWKAYIPETCLAKNISIKLPSCIKLTFHFISCWDCQNMNETLRTILNLDEVFVLRGCVAVQISIYLQTFRQNNQSHLQGSSSSRRMSGTNYPINQTSKELTEGGDLRECARRRPSLCFAIPTLTSLMGTVTDILTLWLWSWTFTV